MIYGFVCASGKRAEYHVVIIKQLQTQQKTYI